MRVGVIGPVHPDSFADNILDCLPDLGVEAVRLGSVRTELPKRIREGLEIVRRWRPDLDARWQRRLADGAIAAGCDVVICVDAGLLPETVQRMRGHRIRTVIWFPDALSQYDRQVMLVAGYDRVYFKDALVVGRLRALTDVPVAYMPEACNPHWHRPQGEPGHVREIVLAGTMYPSRVRLLDRLHDDGIPLRLYGGWPRWMPDRALKTKHVARDLVREKKAEFYRSARGVLNNLHPTELASVNCRLFEAAGSGAAVLCESRPALADLFEVGREVLAFSTYDELRSQCRALLEDAELVRCLGDNAAKRAHTEHTYQRRLTSILEQCAA